MEFIYKQAPLVEVIAEVRSDLIPLTSIPNAAIDPFFTKAGSFFHHEAAKLGYVVFERLLPDGVPLEMIPYQVVARYRRAPDTWPLLQLGPGVFTAHMVPPYSGWPSFRSVLLKGYDAAVRCYAQAGQMRPSSNNLMLRYINGFTAQHGFTGKQAEFLESNLGLNVNLLKEIPSALRNNWSSRTTVMEITADVVTPARSKFTLICQLGDIQGAPACIVEFRVAGRPGEKIEAWFDEARATIRSTFEAIISPELRDRIGPRIEKPQSDPLSD